MGVCALLALVTGLLYARFAARAAYGWGARIREAQYERVQKFAFANLDRFETSSLVTRMTTDVTVLQNAVNGGLRPLVRGPVMLVLGVGFSFWMNARLALVFLVVHPHPGGDPVLRGAEGGPHVRPPAAVHGPHEQLGPGGPDRHPGGEGLRPGGLRGGEIPGGQQ